MGMQEVMAVSVKACVELKEFVMCPSGLAHAPCAPGHHAVARGLELKQLSVPAVLTGRMWTMTYMQSG